MTNPQYAMVITTTDAEEKARSLASEVIDERLAACAQVYAIASVYRWEGRVEQEQEWRIDFKTRGDLVEKLARRIGELHDYDTPEVIALPIVSGSPAYLGWVTAQTQN
ncbi:divalent-cation tolerance protein CutA [Streptomyces phyllanthi]|uniref:Divalent-cation tolerance protein CutA n=1 Tax=Streptomyces phyllanthi TaxID=1803180 RepID=A0A5N8VW51_9ACTN|nr:divalent-cation tolerance protein CutA [Streptomyces phyllanthi]MPY39209.1 divalent-cation tolerance protein CutA [Streptomyces phyllanthi]